MATSMANRIDHRRVRKRPSRMAQYKKKNTNSKKNKITHTPSQPKDNGRMEIPESHLLHHPHQSRPRHTSNPPIRNITTSHTTHTHTTLHRLNGTTICSIANIRLDKLHDIYKHESANPPFEESLANLIQRHNTQHNLKQIQRELRLTKSKTASETQPILCGGCPIPDKLYDTLDACFGIDRILHCNPYNLPRRAHTYYSEDPLNTIFSSEPLTDTT